MAENLKDEATDVAEEGKEKVSEARNGDGGGMKKFLIPAAAGVGTLAAGYAATKAPNFVREQLMPKLEDRGSDEAAKIGKQAVDKVKGGGQGITGKLASGVAGKALGGGGGNGPKKTRRLPIQRWTDVAVPPEKAYEAWTQFEKFPEFMHRVLKVEQQDDKKVHWQEKIWFSKREWEGEVVEQKKNDRIAWKTTSGTQHSGIVSFHKIGDNLTRVMVTVDFQPTGMIEKLASGLRFAKRAVESDLARFKAYVEMENAKQLEYRPVGGDKGGDDESGQQQDESPQQQDESPQQQDGAEPKDAKEIEESRKQRAERREQRKA